MTHTVIVDSKEKNPWDLESYGFSCIRKGLKFGDYAIEGHEDLICIERKASTGEISQNLGSQRARFEKEFQKMNDAGVKNKYLLLEFDSDKFFKFPEDSGIPRKKWQYLKINGQYMFSSLLSLCGRYGVNIIYSPNRETAEAQAAALLFDVLGIKNEINW